MSESGGTVLVTTWYHDEEKKEMAIPIEINFLDQKIKKVMGNA